MARGSPRPTGSSSPHATRASISMSRTSYGTTRIPSRLRKRERRMRAAALEADRRGGGSTDAATLAGNGCSVCMLAGYTTAAGAGQPQERGPQGVVLRPRGEPQLRRDGGALWRGHPPGPAAAAARQGGDGGRGAVRAVLHPRPVAQRDLLLPGGVQRRHRGCGGADEQPRDAPAWHEPPPVVRVDRAPRHVGPAAGVPRRRASPTAIRSSSRAACVSPP